MTSLGETLRRERLKRNLDLNRIADELKISASMLKAIEEERFDKLPGGVFVRSFVRQYARFLNLDEEEIVGELRRVLAPEPETPETFPLNLPPENEIPLPRVAGWEEVSDQRGAWPTWVWAGGGVVALLLISAGGYAWWRGDHRALSAETAPVSAPAAPLAQPSTPQPTAQSAEPGAPERPAPPSAAAEPSRTPEKTTPVSETPGSETTSPAALSSASPAEANPDAAVRVEIVAQESVWVSMRADGQPSFTGVLDAAQNRTIAANRTVWLKVGNAGGVDVLLNGKSIGPIGEKGVVRTLQLTPGGFKILPPDVPKPASSTDPEPF